MGTTKPASASGQPKSLPRSRTFEREATIYGLLVQKGLLTQEELDAVIREAYLGNRDVGGLLIARREIPKQAVGNALSSFYKCPFVEFGEKFEVSLDLIANISPSYLHANLWVPLWQEGTTLHILIDDPHSSTKIQDIQQIFPGCGARFYVGLREDILSFIDTIGKAGGGKASAEAISSILGEAAEEPEAPSEVKVEAEADVDESDSVVVRLVNQIILDAKKAGASDIHIEPYHDKDTIVRLRVDGECQIYQKLPRRYRRALVSRLKIMAGLDIAERRKPQDGKIGFRAPGLDIELRVATIPTVGENEDVVLRILASGDAVPLDGLCLSPENLRDLRLLLESPYGIILVVGPTGSGKTTTLHSMLGSLNGPDRKIWTAEEPVEITQYGLRQVQVQPKIGLTFASAMRSFLRADPDVIMVGEMRDHETIETAIQASLTGHLVLSTMHTNGAAETVTRLLDMGADPFNYADSLLLVLAQRLVRRLCEKCRKPVHPPREAFDELAHGYGPEGFGRLGVSYDEDFSIFEGQGCDACNHTGYHGRLGIHEVLVANDDIKQLIRARAPALEVLRAGMGRGMRTLVQDGILKCLKGETDYGQVRAAATR